MRTRSDSEGRFEFREMPAGLYSIDIEWDLESRLSFPDRMQVMFSGDYLVYSLLIPENKYRAFAISAVFVFNCRKDMVLDLVLD